MTNIMIPLRQLQSFSFDRAATVESPKKISKFSANLLKKAKLKLWFRNILISYYKSSIRGSLEEELKQQCFCKNKCI